MVLHGSPEQLGFSRTGLPISQTQWLLFRQPFPLAVLCKVFLEILSGVDKGTAPLRPHHVHVCLIHSDAGHLGLGLGQLFTLLRCWGLQVCSSMLH